jgi:hypothetical protein
MYSIMAVIYSSENALYDTSTFYLRELPSAAGKLINDERSH